MILDAWNERTEAIFKLMKFQTSEIKDLYPQQTHPHTHRPLSDTVCRIYYIVTKYHHPNICMYVKKFR